MQGVFWLALFMVTLITLTLWYGQFRSAYLLHNLFQALMGLLVSIPLHWFFMRVWDKPVFPRFFVNIIAVLGVALLWTVVRMQSFMWMTGEEGLWQDFGGWYFGGIFIFFCWASTFHGIRYYQLLEAEHQIALEAEAQSKQEQLKVVRAEAVAKDAQLKMLRYQLNPHFLCNTLNAINSLIQLQEADKAKQMTVQLSQFLRYSLDNNPDTKIPLESEISALMLYLEIEKTRFVDRLKIDIDVEDKAKKALVPSLLLQPIIENSMKYAIARSEDGGTIFIKASAGERLVLELSDTGSGVEIDNSKIKSTKGRGVGLSNTDERLAVLYGDDYTFELKVMPQGGLKTLIVVPYEIAS